MEIDFSTSPIAAGELDYQVDVRGHDEIAELGHSFNKMTSQLKQSLDQAQSAAVAKSQFSTTMSHELRTPRLLQGDAARIAQVIRNLLDNAVIFTESGYVSLSIDVSILRGKSARIIIEVKDTGIGIAGKFRDSLFVAFSQVDQSISRRHNGVGLGLAICRRIVELMGGDISVDSTEGEGSRFTIGLNLPLAGEVELNESLQPIVDARVIVVDENPVSQCVTRVFLDAFADSGIDAYLGRFYSREQLLYIINDLMKKNKSDIISPRLSQKTS